MRKRNIIAMLKKAGYIVKIDGHEVRFSKRYDNDDWGSVYWSGHICHIGNGYYWLWLHYSAVDNETFTCIPIVFYDGSGFDGEDIKVNDFVDLVVALA